MGGGGDWCKMVTLLPTCHSKLLGQAGHFFMALWAMPREGRPSQNHLTQQLKPILLTVASSRGEAREAFQTLMA